MKISLRRFLFVLIVGALWLNYGFATAVEQAGVVGDAAASVADLRGSNPHDHGPTDNGGPLHCMTVSCASVFLVQAGGAVSREFNPSLTFGVPREDSVIRPAYLERDPPIPRFSA